MRRLAPAALAVALAVPAWGVAQDLSPRRGFSISITNPKSGEVVSGRVRIEAEVKAPREQDVASVEFYLDDELLFIDREAPYRVTHDFGAATGVHVIRAVARHRDGPTVSDFVITRALDVKYVVNVQRVVMDVSVRDPKRRLIVGLGVEDFAVEEDGRPQKLLSVSPEERPVLVGILIDSSGSMRDRLEQAQEAACRFIATLREEDRAFVIDFDEAVYLVQPVTNDRDALCAAVRSTEAVGGTAMYDAVHAAYRLLYQTEAERRALVVLSDGDDTESRIALDDLLQETLFNDVTVYSIGLDVAPLSEARRALSHLAADTGGRAFFINKADDLANTYDAIAEELRTLYQVVYASDNETFDGRFIKVEIRVPARRDADVRHRRGYYAVPRP